MSFRRAIWLIVLTTTVSLGLAFNYAHDELLWTKQHWDEYKLHFPYSLFRTDEPEVARAKASMEGVFAHTSLEGPQLNLQQLIEDDLKRGKFQPSSFAISLMEDSTPLEGAMAVVQCKVCMALTTQMWDHLVNWTVRTGSTATDDDVAGLGAMLCETEVPVEVLRDWVILHAEVHQVHHSSTGKRIPSKLGAEEFFLLSQRSRQHATEREIEATRSACRALFVDADGEATSGFAQAVAKMQGKYLAKMKEVVGAVDASGLSEEEARLAPERSCMDKHPQCKYWEERGECTANSVYMVGTPETGWCRKACGTCTPPESVPPKEWNADERNVLATMATAILDSLHMSSCVQSTPCRWSETTSAKGALEAAAGADGARASALKQAAIVAGPLSSTPPTVDTVLLDETVVSGSEKAAAAVIKPGPHKPPERQLATAPSKGATRLETRLWELLGERCLYVTTGWWSYEVCYLGSLTQYHTENSNIDEENAGSNVPFVEHTLDDGNVCVLTGENGVGVSGAEATKKAQAKGQVGDTVSRSTSLRFACSPDARRHIVVTEPAQCAYVVEMYLPELCIEPGMAVMLPGGIEFKGVKEEMTVGERSSYDGDLDEEEDEYLDPDDEGDPPQRNGGKGTKDDSEKDEL